MSLKEPDHLTAKVTQKMDRHEFARQYQEIYRQLWLVAAGMIGNRSDADDVVQEAAVIAFQKLDDFRTGTNFTAWVIEIVRRCASNHRRKHARRQTFATAPTELDQQLSQSETSNIDTSLGLAAMESEIDDDMLRVLNQLPKEACCCLLLRIIDGLPYAEISELLGIPEGTVLSHVHRSKKFARERLDSTPSADGGKQ